jgi:hypothetical protein
MSETGFNAGADLETNASTAATQSTIAAVESVEIEKHLHHRSRWFGKSGDQSGTNWATEASLTPFRCISGAGVWGADADDEAKVLGSTDTPIFVGSTKYDPHEIVACATSVAKCFYFRLIYGTGTMAAAITAGQYTMVTFVSENVAGPGAGGGIIEIPSLRLDDGDKLWAQCACDTDNATVDFLIGAHEYAL